MKIVQSIQQMQALSDEQRMLGKTVGVVPTMGFLHEGHLSLIRLIRQRADFVVVTIFVNPTQFAPTEDLNSYPRDFDQDRALCEKEGADAIFYPGSDEMYSPDFTTWVVEESLTAPLCGKSRPTHFRGVTTIVTKLFNAVKPQIAAFGKKDAQQALVIERMVRDLNFDIDILLGDIVRDPSGLAMSSRNKYLSEEQRESATAIHKSLQKAEAAYRSGSSEAGFLKRQIAETIRQSGGSIDYVEIVSRKTLESLETVVPPALFAVAAFYGKTRLIDNLFID